MSVKNRMKHNASNYILIKEYMEGKYTREYFYYKIDISLKGGSFNKELFKLQEDFGDQVIA